MAILGSNCKLSIKDVILDKFADKPTPIDKDLVRNMGSTFSWATTGSGLARKSKLFQPVFDLHNMKTKMRNFLMADHEDMLARLNHMPKETTDRLNAVLEYLRLSKTEIKDTGKPFSIKTRKIARTKDGKTRVWDPALSSPGDTLSLNAEETKVLFEIREYLDSRYTLNAKSILAAFGYKGEYSREGISEIEDGTFKERVLKLYNAIESQRAVSYIPFMRSGDVQVMVYGEDGTIESGAFFLLDSNAWAKNMVGPKFAGMIGEKNLTAQLEAIKKRYPESKGYTIKTSRMGANVNNRMGIDDLSAMDKVLNLMDANSGAMIKKYFKDTLGGMVDLDTLDPDVRKYSEDIARGFISHLPDHVRAILMDQVISGFMKESRNIAGYDTNFIGRIADYNRIVASTVSHRTYREAQAKALDSLMRNADEPERKYAQNWDDYVDTPEWGLWRGARTLGFFNSMWGSFSSSMVNAVSVWTVVAPQMTTMKAEAGLDVYKNSIKVMGAMRGKVGLGFFIDPMKIKGISADEREALIWANKRGTVRAQMNPELMGMESGILKTKSGKIGRLMHDYFQIGASVISVTEEMNKAAAFLTAYKYAQDPVALKNWQEAYGENERAKSIMERGSSPLEVAEFMVETTTFIGGQMEKPPVLRKGGGVMLQFSQYPLQISKLLYQNFMTQGPRGRKAAMFTLLSMFSVSGLLFGIPFGDDAINIFEWLYEKMNGGVKRDFRSETQEMLASILGTENAETLLYGPFRQLLGLNIGERIGFTSMMPELGDPVSAIPALSGTIGKVEEFWERKGDQPIGAWLALLSPAMGKGVSDLVKGSIQLPYEGYKTRYGTSLIAPENITALDAAARMMGFQSAHIAREVQAKRVASEMNEATQAAERDLTINLGGLLADAIRAEEAGDVKKAEKLRAEFEEASQKAVDDYMEAIESGNVEIGIRPPSSDTLREAVMMELRPELRLTSYGKTKRLAIADRQAAILLEDQAEDESDEDSAEYGEDESPDDGWDF